MNVIRGSQSALTAIDRVRQAMYTEVTVKRIQDFAASLRDPSRSLVGHLPSSTEAREALRGIAFRAPLMGQRACSDRGPDQRVFHSETHWQFPVPPPPLSGKKWSAQEF